MRYAGAALTGLSLALAVAGASWAGTAGPVKPAVPPIKQATVRFVSANLETGVVKAKDSRGSLLTFRATNETAVVRNLRAVRGEEFKPKPGESLFIRYWPTGSRGNVLQAVMDARSGMILRELAKEGRRGKLVKVDFPKRAISVHVDGVGPKRWILAADAILLKNLDPARLEGDPAIKAARSGTVLNVLRVGDQVTVVLTRDNKVRGLIDTPSHLYLTVAKRLLDSKAAEGPPQPRQK